jgi:tRNA(fMet)-specific endonuclease VapC
VGFLLDTNIAIHARDGTASVLDKLAEHDGAVLLSALSLAELQRGLFKYPDQTALRQERLKVLIDEIPVLPFDAAAARIYGQIIAQCGWVKGRDFDRMIAAHALRTGSVLITADVANFRDVPGLKIENWAVLAIDAP